MPISTQDKIHLLKDLLQNQSSEQYMTTDEAEQIQRLLSSLSNEPALQPMVQQAISSIAQKHTVDHEPFAENDVVQWLNVLNVE